MNSKNILGSVGDSIASLFGKRSKPTILAPPHLTSAVRFPYGPFQFKFQLPKGAAFEIQASTNLQSWQPILPGKSGGEPVDYVDSDASKFGSRFYRVQTEAFPPDNVVGYVSITLPPGYSLIANPLAAPSNAVSAILAGMPDGTMLNKFDTHLFKLTENGVQNGKWTIDFVGEVMQGDLLMPIAAGFSVRSSQIPKPGRLHTDLGFPINEGDVVHLFDRDRQKYVIYEFDPKEWDSNPPVVGVGEAFWIGKTTPGNWVQRLVIQ